MGGKDKKTTTTTYKPPSWIEGGAQHAMQIGERIASTPYQNYGGERVAGLSDNEQKAMGMAGTTSGIGQPYIDKAASYAERGTQQFTDANMQDYMNPYIKGALDPAAREIRQEGARGLNAVDAKAASMSAFGGSRATLAASEEREKTLQSISDLYGKGYADAYNSAVGIWGDERARDLEAAGRFQSLGGMAMAANETDISTLMTTGAVDRNIQQLMADFDYSEFVDEQNWDFRQMSGLIAALQGTMGSYGTQTTTEEVTETNQIVEVLGMIATVTAAYFSMGASLVVDPNVKDAVT